MLPRVIVGGLFHETNTFVEGLTGLELFDTREGVEMLAAVGDASPLGGALEYAAERGWVVVPAVDLRAMPSATVEDDVVERFWAVFSAVASAEAEPFDGVFLVLHGAMVSQSHLDVEGEILRRIRMLSATAHLPICGVLDLHANHSAAMSSLGDGFLAYRENPHVDAADAARRGAALLDEILTRGRRPATVRAQPPVIWAPTGTSTSEDPMAMLESMARDLERTVSEIYAVNVFGGFSFADTPDTGVCFTAITFGDPNTAQEAIEGLSTYAFEFRDRGHRNERTIESVMPELLAEQSHPVLLVEPSDNIGGGAPGDGTAILKQLLKHDVQGSVVVIADADAAARCHSEELGRRFRLTFGGTKARPTAGPVTLEVVLESKSDGSFVLEDRRSHLASVYGMNIEMGPCAVVRHGGIRILLTTWAMPPFDLGQLRSQGIVPEQASVIGVKAAVAHRRAYDPITAASYTVDTPGPCSSDLTQLPYKNVRRPVYPLDLS